MDWQMRHSDRFLMIFARGDRILFQKVKDRDLDSSGISLLALKFAEIQPVLFQKY